MSKGEETRTAILDHAVDLAATVGLTGVTIGRLAEDMKLSKSGLFAHFRSKEALEIAIVRAAADQFIAEVMMPALKEARGEPRVRALFERWLRWGQRPGGCLFVAAAAELDDRPGPVRDALAQAQRDWLDALQTAAQIAIEERHFKKGLDPRQFAFEVYSLMLGLHHFDRFLGDGKAHARVRRAFESLLERSSA